MERDLKMKIYTRCGDDGYSSVMDGRRIKKSKNIFSVLGTLDELSAHLGLVKAADSEKIFYDIILNIQKKLSIIMAYIASGNDEKYNILKEDTDCLEKWIDEYTEKTADQFSISFFQKDLCARLDTARTVARRAERVLVGRKCRKIKKEVIMYINRLSDLLYVMAKYGETI